MVTEELIPVLDKALGKDLFPNTIQTFLAQLEAIPSCLHLLPARGGWPCLSTPSCQGVKRAEELS